MKRVAVVGCPGAGKSTFCRKLANKVELPIIHLDTYYLDSRYPYYYAQDLNAWETKVAELVTAEQWIMDGNFGSTFKMRFARADTVIVLDYPRYLCMWRIFIRYFKVRKQPRQEVPANWKEKLDLQFIRYVWKFKKQSRHKIFDALKATGADFIVFKRPEDAQKYLQGL